MAKVQKLFIGVAALVAVFFLSAAAGWAAIDPSTVQKLLAGDGVSDDRFGLSVSVSGNTAVIGAEEDDDNGTDSGSAYVFVRNGSGVWTQQAKLLPDDGATEDGFGWSVSISGDTTVIGAYGNDDNGENSGSAYVFVRNGSGIWTQQAKLLPGDGAEDDYFGSPVFIFADTAVIGAPYDDDNDGNSGSAYVFVRNGSGVWTQQAKLLPDDGVSGDYFGRSVFLSGDTAVIGAYGDDDNGYYSGSAYVFVRNGSGIWTQQAKLLPDEGADYDYFGRSVSVSDNTAVIGADGDGGNNGWLSGSAYVFVRNGSGVWTKQAKLLPDDGTDYDRFGVSVSVSGDTAVIGACGSDVTNGYRYGSAYIFVRNGSGVWTQQAKLLPRSYDHFGYSVSISGDTAIIGAYGNDANTSIFGSASAYSRTPTTSNVTITVTAPAASTTYNHGNNVTINW